MAADANDILDVRRRVNGKRAQGLEAAKGWYSRANGVLRGSFESGAPPDVAGLLREAHVLGDASSESASPNSSTENALKAFQKSKGLPENGTLDDATFYALSNPELWTDAGAISPLEVNPSPAVPANPESGVSYDVSSETVSLPPRSNNTESGSSLSMGTGGPPTNQLLTNDMIARLAKAKPLYPTYEIGRSTPLSNFIPFSVILPDDREVLIDTTAFPERAIAQISFTQKSDGQQYVCTGSLIGPDTVVTAGHCVNSGGPGGSWNMDFDVVPGRNLAIQPFGSCHAKKLFALKGWLQSTDPDDQRLYDLGAIKLDCSIGSKTGWLNLDTSVTQGMKTTVIGYPCDKEPIGREWRSRDYVRVLTDTKVFYQNDTYGCMSGSPVFGADTNQIVAIHTNGLTGNEPWSSNNAGTRITQAVVDDLKEWMVR